MKAERWRQIDELFDAALEREGNDRVAFLDEACVGDDELRREVESLLAAAERAGSFIETPVAESASSTLAYSDPLPLTGQLIGHYEILAKLGAGGMGEVYLAEDKKLTRKIALKLLPTYLVRDNHSRARFLREAQLAATLDHPNICTIHEVGEAGGQHFIAMQYVEGVTLKEVIGNRPLNRNRIFSISLQVADALSTAHDKGIMHRDIKPANILVTQRGQAKVLDFGLAKLIEENPASLNQAKTDLTQTGVMLGTPAYMSPEQARGERVDHRSDIFSFGVVMYEMASGGVPFKGKSQPETLNAIINEPHSPVRERNPDAPVELAAVIDRALAKPPENRYQSMQELLADLWSAAQAAGYNDANIMEGVPVANVAPRPIAVKQRLQQVTRGVWLQKLTLLLAAIFLIALVAAVIHLSASKTTVPDAIDSVAVLPLSNAGENPDMEYLADGLSESITNNLSQLKNLRVMSHSSVLRYKGKEIDPQAVASELKVRAVVIGKLIPHGDQVSISLEMVDGRDKHQIWGNRYERKFSDLLQLQADISRDISGKLRLTLTGEEQKLLTKRYTNDNEAYQLYMRGRFWEDRRTEEGFQKAINYFNQALAKDPTYASAYTGLAGSYGGLSDHGFLSSQEGFSKAKDAVKKALALDDQLAEAHTELAADMCFYDWDFEGAEPEYKRAIELNPNIASAHYLYGSYLSIVGRHKEALDEKRRAQELEPTTIIYNLGVGFALCRAGQYDEAIEALRQTLEMDRSFGHTWRFLGLAYLQKRMYNEAITNLREAVKLNPTHTGFIASLGCAYGRVGKTAEAQKLLKELQGLAKQRYVGAYDLAMIYAGLGDKDQAFIELDKAFKEHSNQLAYLKGEPAWDNLRADPRFGNLLQRLGLPQ